ncbi:MAG: PAS domain S-box protein [Candidatus Latescibacteria bacterium]|nr:PAS domain S-box protein [Candidatus Latescibacterota bacterium]
MGKLTYEQLEERIKTLETETLKLKEANELLHQNEAKYKYLVENMDEVIYSVDRNGNIIYTCPSAQNLFGYSQTETSGKSLKNLVHPDDFPRMKERIVEILSGNSSSGEYRLFTSMGDIRWIRTSSKPMYDNDVCVGIQGVLIDITDRKNAEEALRASEERYRTIFNSAAVSFWEYDFSETLRIINELKETNIKDFREYLKENQEVAYMLTSSIKLIDVNEMTLKLYKASSKEELFAEFGKHHTPESYRTFLDALVILFEGKKYFECELTNKRLDGEIISIFLRITLPFMDSGQNIALATVTDITERKKAEKLLLDSEKRARLQEHAINELATDTAMVGGDFNKAMHKLTEVASKALGVERADVWMLTEDKNRFVCIDCYDAVLKKHSEGRLLAVSDYPRFFEALRAGRSLDVSDVYQDPRTNELIHTYLEPFHIVSFIDAPIRVRGELAGVVCHESTGAIRNWQSDEIVFAGEIADQAAQAITNRDRKNAVEALKESENLLRSALDAIPAMLSVHDKDFNILYSNWKGFADVAPEKRIIGNKCHKIYRNSEDVCHDCHARKVLETGKAYITETELPEGVFDIRVIPVIDEHNHVPMFIEYIDDITARKLAEDALRESLERNEAFLRSIPDLIFVLSKDGTYIDYKAESDDELAIPSAGIIGKNIKDAGFSENYIKKILNCVKKALSTKQIQNIEYDLSTPKGLQSYEARITPLNDDYVLSIVRNITDRKLLEEERNKASKLESIGILAGGIAHDFNNILAAILGNISLAKMNVDRESNEYDALLEVEKASYRAKDLTNQLLTFSRGGAPVKETTYISYIIKESAGFSLRGSNVKSIISIEENLWPVEIDKGQISQVMNNLLINADQAMPEGGIINITAKNVTIQPGSNIPLEAGNYIRITIEDKGTGIPEEHLLKIFDPYFTTKQKGSGLGLATSYSIIKQHEGHITVKSKVGTGTTFHIYLPASIKKISEKEEIEDEIKIMRGKVLVMDDDDAIRDVVDKMLELMGHTVEVASDGTEAIELYKKHWETGNPFDVVIMDLTVPGGMGGKEAIQKLIEFDPDIHAIVSSGYSNNPVVAHYEKYGFKGNISKPYKFDELKRVLNKVMTEKVG